MRKIKIDTWKVTGLDGKETDENLIQILNVLIAAKDPKDIPKGIDQFRLFNRIAKAFKKAEDTKIFELEEYDYDFLKKSIEKDIPSVWGMNENRMKAIDLFLDAKQEE